MDRTLALSVIFLCLWQTGAARQVCSTRGYLEYYCEAPNFCCGDKLCCTIGTLVGIVIGACVFLFCVGAAICYCYNKSNTRVSSHVTSPAGPTQQVHTVVSATGTGWYSAPPPEGYSAPPPPVYPPQGNM